MKLSIIVVNYKSRPLTQTLVESLLAQRLPNRTEIIVVDNASHDNGAELLRADFPEITVIENSENMGMAAGVNIAMKRARGEYYLILNPDMVALPNSVQSLVDFMDNHEDAGIGGGKLVSPNNQLQYSCYRFYTPMVILYRRTLLGRIRRGRDVIENFLMKDFDRRTPRAVDWLMGSCLIARAKAVEAVGGMDERYFMYFEDVDWCRRMWAAGWRVMFIPNAVFSHFHQRSSEQGILSIFTNRPTREHILSALKYFWKFRGQPVPEHA